MRREGILWWQVCGHVSQHSLPDYLRWAGRSQSHTYGHGTSYLVALSCSCRLGQNLGMLLILPQQSDHNFLQGFSFGLYWCGGQSFVMVRPMVDDVIFKLWLLTFCCGTYLYKEQVHNL
jgi:hypothetical protein